MEFDQKDMPILGALRQHLDKRTVSFHMPGHKNGSAIDEDFLTMVGRGYFMLDQTEIPGLDDLHMPLGCIDDAQKKAARAFGAKHTYFLVNGSSCGIQAAIMACCHEGDTIVLPRNVHRSVMAGLILSGAEPLWVKCDLDSRFLVPLMPPPIRFENKIRESRGVKGVLYINPTYHGFCGDLAGLIKMVHRFRVPVIVDEAHGPHFHFHKELPSSAVQLGADLTIQSTHKMLTAVNQGSMLHIGAESLISAKEVFRQLTILQTTSPSYPILASLDSARKQMAVNGYRLLEESIRLGEYLRKGIDAIEGISYAPTDDPLKLLVSVRELGITGFSAAEFLRKEFRIEVELADIYNILILITFGNSINDAGELLKALEKLAEISRDIYCRKETGMEQPEAELFRMIDIVKDLPEPVCRMTPRQAWFGNRRLVAPEQAKGMVSAEIVAPYPPGIPLLSPGEEITARVLESIKEIKALRIALQGCQDPDLEYISVVDH